MSPPILNLEEDRYASFKQWKAGGEDYAVVSELEKKAAEYQCAMLSSFNEETRNRCESLGLSKEDSYTVKKIIEVIERLSNSERW